MSANPNISLEVDNIEFLMEKYILGTYSFEFTKELNVQPNCKCI